MSELGRLLPSDLVRRLSSATPETGLDVPLGDALEGLLGEGDRTAMVVLDRLRDGFSLSAFERDVLVLAGLPEEHEALARASRLLHPLGEARLTFAAIVAALDLDGVGRQHLRAALEAGPLRRHGLVELDGRGPLPEQGLTLAAGLWSVIRGHDRWPTPVEPRRLSPLTSPLLAPSRLAAALGPTPQLVVVTGEGDRTASELAAVVAGAARILDTGLVPVDAARVVAETERLLSVHAVARGVHPLIVGVPSTSPLPDHPGPVVICVPDAASLPLDDRPVLEVDLGRRRLGESIGMWHELVPELDGGADRLASVLRVDHVRAAHVVADARAAAAVDGAQLSVTGVVRHARRRNGSDLPASARLVHPRAGWDQLVTTTANHDLIRSVVHRVRGQVRVLHDWGFGARAQRGVRALFAGPPGTGKTLSAHIIAADLDLDLVVVDLSALVSKWLGETEKNISEVFGAAERAQAVLFFDEADAIFGKRTDGNDAQARWANLETAHLLTRMDAYEGLALLATNLRGHIDDAFVRRLDVIVELEEPGPAERLRLWEGHIPPSAPLAADVDLRQLADAYQITGGLIRNATLTAAFHAAAEDRPIDQRTLLDAVEREYQKAGRSSPGVPRGVVGAHTGGT